MNRGALSIHFQSAPATLGQTRGERPTIMMPLPERLRRLRDLLPDQVVPELILILGQIPAEELDLTKRLALLERLERTLVQVTKVLVRARATAPPLPPGQALGVSLEQRLYLAMARACVHLLHELDRGQGFFSEEHARGRVWAIRASLRFLSRGLLYTVATGRPWSPGTWQALHDLFVYLVMRGTVHISGAPRVAEDDELDPELVYKRLLLIGLTVEQCRHRRLDQSLLGRLRDMAAESRLVASDGLVGEFGLVLVDVGRDGPPELRAGSLNDPFRGWVLRVPPAYTELLKSLQSIRARPAARRH